MTEHWKDIKDFEGLYQISSFGRVRSLTRKVAHKRNKFITLNGQIILPGKQGAGYHQAKLNKNGKETARYVHRLIAIAFIPNPYSKPCINHKNGIKTDNYIENLEWCTYKENNHHAVEIGLLNFNNVSHESKCKKINQYSLDGKLIKKWSSITEASKKLNISQCNISRVVAGHKNKAGGYMWRYGFVNEF